MVDRLIPTSRMDVVGGIVALGAFAALGLGIAAWGLTTDGSGGRIAAVIGVLVAVVNVSVAASGRRALRSPGLLLTTQGFEFSQFKIAWSDVKEITLLEGEGGKTHIRVVLQRRVSQQAGARTRSYTRVDLPIKHFERAEEPLLDILTWWWTQYRGL